MRQAGRFLPEYRAVREKHTLLEICAVPELTAEVTLQPIRRFGMDGAIIFADILLPLVPMGIDLTFIPEVGPSIANPIRTAEDVEALRPIDVREALAPTLAALGMVRAELPADTALIGFAGAPFTLASYLIEGGPTRDFIKTKSFMYHEPETFRALMGKLVTLTIAYLSAQAEAGAQVLQLFDSWVGFLGPEDYRRYIKPHSAAIFEALRTLDCPTIHFGVGTGELLEDISEAGGDVIGLDWRVPLDEGWARVGEGKAVQGNLDPAVLYAPHDFIRECVQEILKRANGRPGHVFNLGHGVNPTTPIDSISVVLETCRSWNGAAVG
jgi:uroporphyrinogen decarboxylase